MKKIIFIILSVIIVNIANAQYCVDGGPVSTVSSNVEQVNINGESGTSISHSGCDNGGSGYSGVEDLTFKSVDLIAGNTYNLDVLFGTCSTNSSSAGQVWIDYDQDKFFDLFESIGQSNGTPGTAPWDAPVNFSFTVPTDAYNGSTRMRVMMRQNATLPLNACSGYSWGSVMDFTINISGGLTNNECNRPINLDLEPADNNVVITWDPPANGNPAFGYDWEIVPDGAGQGNSIIQSGTITDGSTNLNVSSLIEDTDYDFYIRSKCSSGDPNSIYLMRSFRTICTIKSFPYSTDFEEFNPLVFSNPDNSDILEDENCWDSTQNTENFGWIVARSGLNASDETGPAADLSGEGNYIFLETSGGNNDDVAFLTLPDIDLTTAIDPELTFYYHMYGSQTGSLEVYAFDATNVTGITTLLTETGEQHNSDDDSYDYAALDLSAFAGTVVSIGFRGYRGTGFRGDIAIDNVRVDEKNPCKAPKSFTVDAIDATTATINWAEGSGNTNDFHFEYGPAPYNLGDGGITGTTGTGPASETDLTNLLPDTEYDFYVVSNCSSNTTSYFNRIRFKTLKANDFCVDAIVLPVNGELTGQFFENGTDSGTLPDSSCAFIVIDLWYTVEIPASGKLTIETDTDTPGEFNQVDMTAYSGDCTLLVEVACDENGGNFAYSKLIIDDISLANQIVYLRASSNTDFSVEETFKIMTYEIEPTNIDCGLAQPLAIGVPVSGSTLGANDSNEDPFCESVGGDVWYSWDQPLGQDIATIQIVDPFNSGEVRFDIYEGSCGALTSLNVCGQLDWTLFGLTPGSTYYIQAFHTEAQTRGDFEIRVDMLPSNNWCDNAELLTLDSQVSGATWGATDAFSQGTACGSKDGVVWYKWTQGAASTTATIDVQVVSALDTTIFYDVFSGVCNSFTSLGVCGTSQSITTLNGLTPGETYQILLSNDASKPRTDFNITVSSQTLGLDSYSSNSFKYFPNPVENTLNISAKNPIKNILIFDILGKEVLSKSVDKLSDEIDLTALTAGAYFMKVTIGNFNRTYKLIKD